MDVVPMIYKGNYKKNTAWIKEITEWYVKNSKGAAVWAGIQSYRNDDNPTGAIKFLHKNVKNLNLSVYTNNSNFIKTMKEVGRSKDCHVINDNSSKWSAHKYGIAILKDSGIFGYLTS